MQTLYYMPKCRVYIQNKPHFAVHIENKQTERLIYSRRSSSNRQLKSQWNDERAQKSGDQQRSNGTEAIVKWTVWIAKTPHRNGIKATDRIRRGTTFQMHNGRYIKDTPTWRWGIMPKYNEAHTLSSWLGVVKFSQLFRGLGVLLWPHQSLT